MRRVIGLIVWEVTFSRLFAGNPLLVVAASAIRRASWIVLSGMGSRGAGRPMACRQRTADAWTSSSMGLQLAVARFAATRPRCPVSQGRVTLSLAPSKSMGPPALQVAERRKQAAYPELARRPANTAGAGVRDRRSLEHRGSALRPRPGPLAGPTRASRRQGRRSVRMGATMVERLVSGGAARGGKHCPRPPLARGSTAVL